MKKIYIISAALTTAAIIAFLCAAPHLIRTTILSENNVSYEQPVPSIAGGRILSQQFVPQYEMIKNIEIYINALSCSRAQGYLHISISGPDTGIAYENQLALSELPEYGMTSIADDITVIPGSTYTLSLEAVDTADNGPAISFYPTMIAANTEEQGRKLTYGGLPLADSVLRASFRYSVPLAPINYLAYCFFIAFVILFCAERLKK